MDLYFIIVFETTRTFIVARHRVFHEGDKDYVVTSPSGVTHYFIIRALVSIRQLHGIFITLGSIRAS